MSLAKTQQSVGIAVMKKAMNAQQAQSVELINTMQSSAPSFGHQLDVRA